MTKIKLTEEDIFNYIKEYILKNGYGPTRREIYFNLDIGPSKLHEYIKNLKEDGKITKVGSIHRYCILKDG